MTNDGRRSNDGPPKLPPDLAGSAASSDGTARAPQLGSPASYPAGTPPFTDKQRVAYAFYLLGVSFTRVGLSFPRHITLAPGDMGRFLAIFGQEGPPENVLTEQDGVVTLAGIEVREP